jgi:hypothetical protein
MEICSPNTLLLQHTILSPNTYSLENLSYQDSLYGTRLVSSRLVTGLTMEQIRHIGIPPEAMTTQSSSLASLRVHHRMQRKAEMS